MQHEVQTGAPAGHNPMDPTGAATSTIGVGQAPGSGEQGFSGNAEGQGAPEQVEGDGQQPSPMG